MLMALPGPRTISSRRATTARRATPQARRTVPVEIVPIGIKARHLNRTYDYGGDLRSRNQLDHLGEAGMLQGALGAATVPAAYDFRPVEAGGISEIRANELEHAARSYLDINCAHCHSPTGIQGMTSQLFFNHDNIDVFRLGVCKQPGSAGPGNGDFTSTSCSAVRTPRSSTSAYRQSSVAQ